MILTTTDTISGKELETLGLVKGSTIQTVNAVRDIGAGLKTLVGGELTKYNEMMKYEEVLRRIQQADILVDAIQGNSTGLTIKTCEAVVYNKKLITTNKEIIKYPFYDSKYICVVDSADDISDSFLYENRDVKFSEEGTKYFSIDNYVEKLNSMVVYE